MSNVRAMMIMVDNAVYQALQEQAKDAGTSLGGFISGILRACTGLDEEPLMPSAPPVVPKFPERAAAPHIELATLALTKPQFNERSEEEERHYRAVRKEAARKAVETRQRKQAAILQGRPSAAAPNRSKAKRPHSPHSPLTPSNQVRAAATKLGYRLPLSPAKISTQLRGELADRFGVSRQLVTNALSRKPKGA